MFPTPDSDEVREGEVLAERVEALAAWIQEVDTRLRAAELTTGDEKTAKELRKAVEAVAKHDPKLEDRLTNRVDVLKDRLATLAETVGATSAALAAKDGEIVALKRTLEAEHARLEALLAGAPQRGGSNKELEDLRKAVDSLASQKSKSRGGRKGDGDAKLDGTLEVVQQRLDMLAETVSTTAAGQASRDGEIAALRRRLDEDGQKIEGALAELRAAVDPVPLAELKLAVKELGQKTSAQHRQTGQGVRDALARLEALSGELGALTGNVAAASEGLTGSRQDLAALRGAFDEETGRLDQHVARLEQGLAALAPRLAALDGLAGRELVEALEERVRGFGETLDSISGRLAALSNAVEENGQGYAARELELAALSRRFEEERATVQGLVAEVRAEVQALADAGATAALEEQVAELAGRVEAADGKLLEVGAAGVESREQATRAWAELAGAIEDVARKMDSVDRERATLADELQGELASAAEERLELAAGARLLEERVRGLSDAFEERAGGLSEAVAELSQATDETRRLQAQKDHELEELSSRFEEGRRQVDALVGDLRAALETMPVPDPARLDELATQVGSFAARLHEAEAARATSADELRAELASSADELRGELATSAEERSELAAGTRLLEERLHTLGESVAALSRTIEEAAGGDAAREQNLAELSGRVDEATGRLGSQVSGIERSLAALEPRLQALTEAVEAGSVDALEERLQESARTVAQVQQQIDAVERERASSLAELRGALADASEERLELAAGARLLEERLQGLVEALDEGRTEVGRRLEDTKATVDGLVADVRSQMRALAESQDGSELGARLDGLARELEGLDRRVLELAPLREEATTARTELAHELSQLRAAFDEETGRLDSHVATIEQSLAALAPQVQDLERFADRGSVEGLENRLREAVGNVEQATHRIDALERERASSRAELQDALVASTEERVELAAATRLLEERVHGLSEALELTRAEAGTVSAELRAALEGIPAPDPAQGTRLEVLAQAVETQAATVAEIAGDAREAAGLRGVLDVLAGRLDALDASVDVLGAQPADVTGRLDELATRLESLAADVTSRAASKEHDLLLGKVLLRLDAMEREQQALTAELGRGAASSGPSEDVVAELRLLVENARSRLELLEIAAHPSGTHVEQEPAQVVQIRKSEG